MLILASASPRRQELLTNIGIKFRSVVSDIKEITEEEGELLLPSGVAMENARRKAMSVAKKYPHDIVIGADTIVALDDDGRNVILGKPKSKPDAIRMLSELSGRQHSVYTGIAIAMGRRRYIDVVMTKVRFAPISEDEIEQYVATGEPMDKAGAYAIQARAAVFIEEIKGSYTNVVGLPLNALFTLAKKAGIRLYDDYGA